MYELSRIVCIRGSFRLSVEHCHLEQGATYVVAGPNSAGKSTFLDVLALQREPAEGELVHCGQNVNWDDRRDLLAKRRRTAYLMQNPYLFQASVAENIGYGLRLRGLDNQHARDRISVISKRLSLDHLLERSAQALSGGEAQRVAIARTLVLDADVYLLDEPTVNVDRRHVSLVEDVIRETVSRQEATAVITTHVHDQAYRLSSRHISIIDGQIRDVVYENVMTGELRIEKDGAKTVWLPEGVRLGVAEGSEGPVTVVIDPKSLILSSSELESSARNRLSGTVTRVEDQNGTLRINIDVGVMLSAQITRRSFDQMGLNIGHRVWVTFKASAVRVL